MNYRITNGKLLLYKNGEFTVEKSDLYIKDSTIFHIGILEENDGFETVDAGDRLIMPGLINMHTHAYMTAMRNLADDVDFSQWLFGKIMPVEDNMKKEEAYWSSMLGCMEMIQTGTTCFVDMHMFEGRSAKAATKSGMRAFIGRGLTGDDINTNGLSRLEECHREKEKYSSGLVDFIYSPHAIYSCSPKLYEQIAALANENGMLMQTHASESEAEVKSCIEQYSKTPIEVMYDAGFLGERTLLAHCVKLSEHDMDLLYKTGTTVVTNCASNAKLGNGIAHVPKMLEKGINVTIGTDSTASNNTLNMFREMNLISLMHKAESGSSVILSAQTILKSALINSARALGKTGLIGEIQQGAYADLVFINLNSTSLFPNNNIISSLCYSANGSEVESVMINGKFVMRNKELLTIDRERILYEVRKII